MKGKGRGRKRKASGLPLKSTVLSQDVSFSDKNEPSETCSLNDVGQSLTQGSSSYMTQNSDGKFIPRFSKKPKRQDGTVNSPSSTSLRQANDEDTITSKDELVPKDPICVTEEHITQCEVQQPMSQSTTEMVISGIDQISSEIASDDAIQNKDLSYEVMPDVHCDDYIPGLTLSQGITNEELYMASKATDKCVVPLITLATTTGYKDNTKDIADHKNMGSIIKELDNTLLNGVDDIHQIDNDTMVQDISNTKEIIESIHTTDDVVEITKIEFGNENVNSCPITNSPKAEMLTNTPTVVIPSNPELLDVFVASQCVDNDTYTNDPASNKEYLVTGVTTMGEDGVGELAHLELNDSLLLEEICIDFSENVAYDIQDNPVSEKFNIQDKSVNEIFENTSRCTTSPQTDTTSFQCIPQHTELQCIEESATVPSMSPRINKSTVLDTDISVSTSLTGLVNELSTLNQYILNCKRELETARRQRQIWLRSQRTWKPQ